MLNREDLIKYYEHCFPKVKSLVKKITGEYYNDGDEEDIFQDALIVFYENLINNKLILTTDPCGYIYGVAKNKARELREKRERERKRQKERNDKIEIILMVSCIH